MTITRPDSKLAPVEISDEALHWIVRLNSGNATDADWHAWQVWRAADPEHERAALEAEHLWAGMSALRVDRKTGLARPRQEPTTLSRRNLLAGIGTVAACGTVGYGAWSSGLLTPLLTDHSSSVASTQLIQLPDGSNVTLNARSAINVDFGSGTRNVELVRGQAFFEIAGDASRIFRLRAGNVAVEAVHAASFDVVRDLPDSSTEVAVAQNAARVAVSGAEAAVRQGQIVGVDQAGRIGPVRSQDASMTASWRQGVYIADDRTLNDVIAALSAWHRGTIMMTGSELGHLRVNAVLDLRDPLGSLDALQGGLPIRVRHFTRFMTTISAA